MKLYELERDLSYTNRVTSWTGKIGLMYPSDIGFAAIGSEDINRKMCLSLTLSSFSEAEKCIHSTWYNKDYWTLMPMINKNSLNDIVFVLSLRYGGFSTVLANSDYHTFPVVYLKTNVSIVFGTGAQSDPFQLSQS